MTTPKTPRSAEEKAEMAKLRRVDSFCRPLVTAFLQLERMCERDPDWSPLVNVCDYLEEVLNQLHPEWRNRPSYQSLFVESLCAEKMAEYHDKKQAEETLQRLGIDLDCPS